jgi:glutamate--cysteine ligase/glutathione synthase
MEHTGYEGLELSTRLLIEAAFKRDIQVDVLDKDDNFIRLSKDHAVQYVKQATKTSVDSYIAPLIMENKQVTKAILREHGVNVPDGVAVRSIDEAMDEYPAFEGRDTVVKPCSTNFGKGVVILKGTMSRDDYRRAVEQAFEYDGTVLLETFIPGDEYRFLVIGDETVAVLHRVPANVVGDGVRTIAELVSDKNKDPLRGRGYVTPLEQLSLGAIEKEHLAAQGKDIQYIPDKGETVYLRENSNISTGGDSIDFTDSVVETYKVIAVDSAKVVGARICGVDMIIRDIHEEPSVENHSIIELNFNPALHIHDFPYKGENRHVEEKVLDILGF